MERMLVSAAPYFAAAGVESHVFGRTDAANYSERLREAGYVVHMTSSQGMGSWRDLARTLRRGRFDVVHIHTEGKYLATVLAVVLASRGRARIVRTVHNVFNAQGLWLFKRRLQATLADPFVHVVVAPSDDVVRHERMFGRRPRLIYNWVDDEFFDVRRRRRNREEGASPAVGLIVGNCSEVKRHELALEAVSRLGHSVAHLGIETSASQQEAVLLDKLDQAGVVLVRGVGDPALIMSTASYFLMPSVWEGMGVALAEALVAGLPAVVSDSPGLQWSKGLPGVSMVPPLIDEWTAAIDELDSGPAPAALPIDFSASRGVSEYLSIYAG
ncbi:glycosyltransferase family 4 protein [Blastococcus sp. HT6-30]|uniref:glycosyltransferase family 4 protein n=1 Tax=Blastococcus sp. HT6-30 TaxID=3144843 RepID=UPI00321B7664